MILCHFYHFEQTRMFVMFICLIRTIFEKHVDVGDGILVSYYKNLFDSNGGFVDV